MAEPTLDDLAGDLRAAARSAGKQARGLTAKALDRAAAQAKTDAQAKWRKTGKRTDPAIDSIRPRMSRTIGSRGGQQQTGFLMVDSPGGAIERGGGHTPPNPVLGPAVEAQLPWLGDRFTDELGPFGRSGAAAGRVTR